MHPVLENIIARREKLGPFSDGRKIMLVLYGGVMSVVRGTGVTTALQEMGLVNAFDEVFTFSAGFPNASYFLSDQARLSTSVHTDDLSGNSFIDLSKPWNIVNVNHLIDTLEFKKRLRVERIFESRTRLFFCGLGIPKLIRSNTEKSRKLTRTTTSNFSESPPRCHHLTPGTIEIGGVRYKDTKGYREEFPRAFLSRDASDILVVYSRRDQRPRQI
jgi:hypothetical protein